MSQFILRAIAIAIAFAFGALATAIGSERQKGIRSETTPWWKVEQRKSLLLPSVIVLAVWAYWALDY